MGPIPWNRQSAKSTYSSANLYDMNALAGRGV